MGLRSWHNFPITFDTLSKRRFPIKLSTVGVSTVFYSFLCLGPAVRNIIDRIVAGDDVSDFSDLSESDDEDC